MKGIWRRKWWVLPATVAIFLSVGAVAWAATGGDQASATAASTTVTTTTATGDGSLLAGSDAAAGADSATVQRAVAGLREMKQRGQQWLRRQAALMKKLRAQMSPEDQALCDQLLAKFKDQREALQQARQNLVQTAKQLRDLRNKYQPATTTTTS